MFHINLRRSPLFIALSLVSSLAIAQSGDEGTVEEVVVTGKFLKSLQSAMDVKRNSASVVEAIAPEDIGQLPDVSISDSLKRLPGLAQDRDRGNGSQISIRGMGGMLGFTTLNGREVAILEETRNIRYDQFPAELINGAQVYKTPQAWISEGGVSGTVNLNTIKPLDYDSTKVVVDLRATASELGGDIDDASNSGLGERFSISYIDQFLGNTLGVALGYSGRSESIATQRAELWNYGDTSHNTQWNDALGANVNAPWGGSALVRGGEDKRQGVMAALQWQPTDSLEIAYDGFWSAFDIEEDQRGFDFGIDGTYTNQWVLDRTTPTAFDNVKDATAADVDLLAGTVSLSSLRNLNENYVQDDELISNGINVKWQEGDWTVKADAAFSETSRDKRWATVRTANSVLGKAKFDATRSGRMTFDLLDADLTDLTQNTVSEIQVQPQAEGGDEIASFKLDFQYDVDVGLLQSVKFGTAFSSREKFERSQIWNQAVTAQDNALTDAYVIDAKSSSYWGDLPGYLSLNRNAVMNNYFGGLKNPTPGDADDLLSNWEVSEDISAQYVQLDLAADVFGLPLSGNVGVRNVGTDTTASGYQQGPTWWDENNNWAEVPGEVVGMSVDHDYSDVLPSTNWTLGLTDTQLIRMSAAKTMARAPVNMMSPSLNLNEDRWGANPGESTSGNPKLNPFRADQFDLAYEWYYSDNSQIAVNLFYKDLESFITRAANAETIVRDGVTYNISRPINGSGGYIRGYELLWQQSFDFLPAPFDGLGIYTNFSHNESNVEQALPLHSNYKASLTGLSENVGNFTLWYYLNGFEARTSYSYRSAFQRDINLVMGEEGMNDSEGYWDLSLSYEINDHYKVSFQVQNLTNEPYTTYGLESNNPAHINKYEEFGTRYSVGLNWKL